MPQGSCELSGPGPREVSASHKLPATAGGRQRAGSGLPTFRQENGAGAGRAGLQVTQRQPGEGGGDRECGHLLLSWETQGGCPAALVAEEALAANPSPPELGTGGETRAQRRSKEHRLKWTVQGHSHSIHAICSVHRVAPLGLLTPSSP